MDLVKFNEFLERELGKAKREERRVAKDIYEELKLFKEGFGKPFKFNLSVAGYGKTTHIIRTYFKETTKNRIVTSYLRTTIDRIKEKYIEEKQLNKNANIPFARTFHSIAYQVLKNREFISGSPKDLKTAVSRFVNNEFPDKKKEYYNDLMKIFKSSFGLNYEIFLEYPIDTLKFKIGYIEFLKENSNILLSKLNYYIENSNLADLQEVALFRLLSKFYYDVLEPLYYNSDKYLNYVSLLGLVYKLKLDLFGRVNLRKIFSNVSKSGELKIIVDEYQDLNPLMIHLILRSYREDKQAEYVFYGDPFQAVNSFQGSSIKLALAFAYSTAKKENIIFENKTYRIPKNIVEFINKKRLIPKIKSLLPKKLGELIKFDEIISLRDEDEKCKELREILTKSIKSFEDLLFLSREKKIKVAFLLKTNEQVLELMDILANQGFAVSTTQRHFIERRNRLLAIKNSLFNKNPKSVLGYDVREFRKFAIDKFIKAYRLIRKGYLTLIYDFLPIMDLLMEVIRFNEKFKKVYSKEEAQIKNFVDLRDYVWVSTINAFKGKEADVVILLSEGGGRDLLEKYLSIYTALTRTTCVFTTSTEFQSLTMKNKEYTTRLAGLLKYLNMVYDVFNKRMNEFEDNNSSKKSSKSTNIRLKSEYEF